MNIHSLIDEQRANNRSKTILKRLYDRHQITDDGVRGLVAALDPMHDSALEAFSWPDGRDARSIPRIIRKSATYKMSTLGATVTDLRVDFIPFLAGALVGGTYNTAGVIPTFAGGFSVCPGVNIFYGAAGAFLNAMTLDSSLALPAQSGVCARRINAVGIEVVNSTADIYKNGSVTMWRQACTKSIANLFLAAGGIGGANPCTQADFLSPLPAHATYMTSIPDSVTYSAKNGSYQQVVLNGTDNPAKPLTSKMVVVSPAPPGSTSAYVAYNAPTNTTTAETTNHNFCGAYYAGLSQETTLTITVKYFVEDFFPPYDVDNQALTRGTAPYDPMFFEILSRVQLSIPPGVSSSKNPLGEWFEEVMDAISAVSPVLAAIPGVGAIVSPLVGGASAALSSWNKNARQKGEIAAQTSRNSRGPPPPLPPRPHAPASAKKGGKKPLNRRIK